MGTSRRTAPVAGRMIAWTAAAALGCWGAALSMVRAVAQQTAPPPEAVPASPEEPDTNEEAPSDRARTPVAPDEPPQFRDSADNNISLPVDI